MKRNYFILGKGIQRVDALGKVTGEEKFAEDYNLPDQIYGKVLRASYPHARIISINTEKAKTFAGVKAILTAKDLKYKKQIGVVKKDHYVLCEDKVRYYGDGVAIVAADTPEICEEALKLIEVQYEPLRGVFHPMDGLKENAPLVWDEGNLCNHHKVRKGNCEKGFKESDIIFEKQFKTPRVEHSYIEPECVLAEPLPDGVKITGSIQNLFSTRRAVSEVLGIPLAKVQLIQATLGGSFGGKDDVMTIMCCRAALLCKASGKPVKMIHTREESFLESYKRHPYFLNYKFGIKKDGTPLSIEIEIFADAGAYTSMTPFVTWRSAVQATGPYRIPNVKTDVYGVFTNNNYTGAMRGFGSPQVNFAIETLIDEVSESIGMNPLEYRLKFGFENGDITATGQKLIHKVSLKEALIKACEKIDYVRKWEKYRKERNSSGWKKRGIGLSCSYRGVSLGAEGVDAAGVIVSVQSDGSVLVSSGITDMGQGAQTAITQVAAEELGIAMEKMVFLNTNTSRVPDSGPTVASRGTLMGGNSAINASRAIKKRMLKVASEILKVPVYSLTIRNGIVMINKIKKTNLTFKDLASECFKRGIKLIEVGWYKSKKTSWDEDEGQGDAYFTFVYGANVSEIEVDIETGKVDVINFVSAHEVGKAVNLHGVLGQIYGGVAMGLGYGTIEEFEQIEGTPLCLNFDEYLIPTSMDVPQMEAIIIENPDKLGPFGAKSLGEPTNEIAAPAIVNAIANATGKRIYEIPANLEVVLLSEKLTRKTIRTSVAVKC